VTNSFKVVAWVMFIFINLFFVYFCLLRAMTRDRGWQHSYLVACFLQWIVEVFLYESFECIWIHYGIPRLVAEEVEKTLNQIHDTIDEAFAQEQPDPKLGNFLDAPSYFFVSSNLAEIFPQTFESSIVSVYRSIYPAPGGYVHNFRQIDKYQSSVNLRENRTWGLLKRFGFTTFLLSLFGTFPIRIQKFVIHVIQPLLLAFLLLAWAYISSSLLLTVLACMALIMIGMLFVRWLLSQRRSPRSSSPRRSSSQKNKFDSFRNLTTVDALHHPSFSVPSNDNEANDVERCEENSKEESSPKDQPSRQNSSKATDDHCIAIPNRQKIIVDKSDEEKGDPDLESFDYDSKRDSVVDQSSFAPSSSLDQSSFDPSSSLDQSSLDSSNDPFADPFDQISSFDDDVQDPYELSASSDDTSSSNSTRL
jgi:hypothetical protein